jgi:plastocyanin
MHGARAFHASRAATTSAEIRIIHLVVRDMAYYVDAWKTRTRPIDGIGEARVEFVTPATPGETVYSCTPHGSMMHGTIRVE